MRLVGSERSCPGHYQLIVFFPFFLPVSVFGRIDKRFLRIFHRMLPATHGTSTGLTLLDILKIFCMENVPLIRNSVFVSMTLQVL